MSDLERDNETFNFFYQFVTINIFESNEYSLDFLREKTKIFLLYLDSLIKSKIRRPNLIFGGIYNIHGGVFNVADISIFFSFTDLFDNPTNINSVYVMRINYEDVLNLESNNFTQFFKRNIDKYKNNSYHIVPLKSFNIEVRIYLGDDITDRVYNNNIDDDDDENTHSEIKINKGKTFEIDECVICMSNLPNILFCNCGHIAICSECVLYDDCGDVKPEFFKVCPICKTETTLLRELENNY